MAKKFEYTISLELLDKIKTEFEDLKDRKSNPEGKFDKKGRFYLDEKFDCCKSIRTPSRAFPYSEMHHGRTLVHVLYQNGLTSDSLTEVKKYINSFKAPRKIEKNYCYKKVVVSKYLWENQFESIYSQSFIWEIGKKSKPKFDGDFVFGFDSIEDCINFDVKNLSAKFENSTHDNFAILKCECPKKFKEIDFPGKRGYAWLKPIEWVMSQKEF